LSLQDLHEKIPKASTNTLKSRCKVTNKMKEQSRKTSKVEQQRPERYFNAKQDGMATK
jgi:hypothetical protein